MSGIYPDCYQTLIVTVRSPSLSIRPYSQYQQFLYDKIITLRSDAVPGIPETVLVESGLDEAGLLPLMIHLLELGWRDISNRFQQSFVVVPGDPIQCGELDIVEPFPRSLLSNDFCFVQADDRLGERVVVGVPDAPD